MDLVKFGQTIKQLRKRKGVTQEQLAYDLGVNSRSVSRWETGRTFPDIDVLLVLCEYYEVSMNDILQSSGNISQEVFQLTHQQEQRARRRMCMVFIFGLVALSVDVYMYFMQISNLFAQGMVFGVIAGCLLCGLLLCTPLFKKMQKYKYRLWYTLICKKDNS